MVQAGAGHGEAVALWAVEAWVAMEWWENTAAAAQEWMASKYGRTTWMSKTLMFFNPCVCCAS